MSTPSRDARLLAVVTSLTLACGCSGTAVEPPSATIEPERPAAAEAAEPPPSAPPPRATASTALEAMLVHHAAGDARPDAAALLVLQQAPLAAAQAVVLYAWDQSAFDRAALLARDPSIAPVLARLGAEVSLEAADGGELCRDRDTAVGELRCRIELSPTEALALRELCEVRSIGIAVVEEERPGVFAIARAQQLVAHACEPSARQSELSVSDLDGDGAPEIRAVVETIAPMPLHMPPEHPADLRVRSAFFLDARDLHLQLEVELEVDSWGSSCAESVLERRVQIRFAARDDGRLVPTVSGRERVEECPDDDDIADGAIERRVEANCRYVDQEDRWSCSPDVATALDDEVRIGGHSLRSSAERGWRRGELLGPGGAGARFPAMRAQIQRVLALEAEDAPRAPSGTVVCPVRVEDPAPPLHVRAERSSRSAIVGDLENGTVVAPRERRGSWVRIDAPVPGWVWSASLRDSCNRQRE
ncbi:Hypothetical protein I5071_28660 [Sandaracinus amylolyticus]|nr:Hypothetical protein I5071_28660 [Sandaracinus amylolyticus]